jgi:hypothetical protein
MSRASVRSAVAARVAAVWSWCEIRHENGSPEPPTDESPVLLVEYPFAVEEPTSVGSPGSNRQSTFGAVVFRLLFPAGAGVSPWDERLDALGAAFRNWQAGELRFDAADPPVLHPTDSRLRAEMSIGIAYEFTLYA